MAKCKDAECTTILTKAYYRGGNVCCGSGDDNSPMKNGYCWIHCPNHPRDPFDVWVEEVRRASNKKTTMRTMQTSDKRSG
jgi:hypothetical protein